MARALRCGSSLHTRHGPLSAAFIAAALLVAPAAAHPGQTLDLSVYADDEAVRYQLLISADLLALLLSKVDVPPPPVDLRGDGSTAPEVTAAVRAGILRLIAGECPLTIDDVAVAPEVRHFEFLEPAPPIFGSDEALPADLRLDLDYPTGRKPQRIGMVWRLYPDAEMAARMGSRPGIVARLMAYREDKVHIFTPDEPELIWHFLERPRDLPLAVVSAEGPPAPMLRVPVLSVLLVAGSVAVLGFLGVRPARRRWLAPALALAVLPLVGAVATRHTLVAQVPAPWAEGIALPDAGEACEVFAALQRNVYRAFEYRNEGDVYDILAQSVDGPLLDAVYNEIYHSLILREHGGAVARVESIELLEVEHEGGGTLPEERVPAFRVRSRWQVHGAVYHWGHVHLRTNEYEARYTVAQRDRQWKIVGVEYLAQRPVQSLDEVPDALRTTKTSRVDAGG